MKKIFNNGFTLAGATHVDMPPINAKGGFTLAEVLITLGIIGIVAAMTLPTLVQNYKKKELVTKLQKVYTVMNQAINLAEVENGNFEKSRKIKMKMCHYLI